MQRPPVGDICRFKGGELLAWTTKCLHEIPMLSLVLGQKRKQITGLKRAGQ